MNKAYFSSLLQHCLRASLVTALPPYVTAVRFLNVGFA
jgi:hypothetical protein